MNACVSVCNRCGEGRSPSTPPRRLPRPSWSSSPASKLAIPAVRYAHTLLLLVAAASASGCSHALIARSHDASRPCDAHAMASSLTCARSDCLRAGLDRCGSRWRLGSPSARRWCIAVSVPDDISRRLILEELAGPPCGASATAACTIFSSACAAAMVAMECALPACVPAAFAHRPSVPFILVLPRHAMRARRGPAWCLVEVCHWSSLMLSMCFQCPVTMCNMVRSLKFVLITGTRPELKRAQHATYTVRTQLGREGPEALAGLARPMGLTTAR